MAARCCVLALFIVFFVTERIHANDELENEFRKLVNKVIEKQVSTKNTLAEHVKRLKELNVDIDKFIEGHAGIVRKETRLTKKMDNMEIKAQVHRKKFDALVKYFPKQVLDATENIDDINGENKRGHTITDDVPGISVDNANVDEKYRNESELEIEHVQQSSKSLIGQEFRRLLRSVNSKCAFENVAFMASSSKSYEHVEANFTVNFDDENLNDGFGYNSETNIFAAPRRGVYMITMNFGWHQEYTAIKLVINGKDTVAAFGGYRVYGNGVGGNSVMVDLKRGDKVWVISGDVDNGRLQGSNNCCRFTTFSGFLML